MAYVVRTAEQFHDFITRLIGGRRLFALSRAANKNEYHIVSAESWNAAVHTLGDFRPVEPLKSLLFSPRASLGSLFDDQTASPLPERIVVGVKNCDLSSLQIHDYVFLNNDPVDSYYKEAREKTLLVTADCAAPCEVCFCTAVGEQPFPKQGFDINLSPLASGCLVEIGSPRGEQAIEPCKNLLEQADEMLVKQRDEQRQKVAKQVSDQSAGKGLRAGLDYQTAVKKTLDSKLWSSFAADCVECGACNFSCCTCHCFLLADGMTQGNKAGRIRQWDSCLYMNFAQVAGGANPRQHRAERLYNRFDKKFNFFPEVLKTYACDGCGRCIEACTGKIDIRDVLKKALDEIESV